MDEQSLTTEGVDEDVHPSALWPEGWCALDQARAAGAAEAVAAARDRSRWVKGKPHVDWEAIHLQVARGRTYIDIEKEFKVSRRSISDHAVKRGWMRLHDETALKRMAFEVARVGRARAVLNDGRPTEEEILRSCQWKPLERMVHCRRHVMVEADEKKLHEKHSADDPDNPDCDWRGRAKVELPRMLEEAGALGDEKRVKIIEARAADLSTEARAQAALKDFRVFARAAQLPPDRPWRIWMLMGGRGAGKTRAGAEWVRALIENGDAQRVALVGPTLHDVREVMIEGPSGLKAVASEGMVPTFNVTRRRLEWPNKAVGLVFSAEDPDSLRGPQFDAAWCDEIGTWTYDEKTWDTLMFAMRLGANPRIAATTTPRARKLVRRLHQLAEERRGGVALTRAATRENAANLAPGFIEAMEESYRGTQLGRQELDGEMICDLEGAMFLREKIEAGRVRREEAGELERIVVAVDPPAGAGERAAACGIVCAGRRGNIIYVLEDASARGLRPAEWARRAVDVAKRNGAGVIVAEANQGGEMVRAVIEAEAKGEARVRLRHAAKSKRDRAEPVSVEYEKDRVKHVGVLQELEDEMCSFGAPDAPPGPSPDRVDALVWAVSELMKPPPKPGIIDLWAE